MTETTITKSVKYNTRPHTLTTKQGDWAMLVALANADRRTITGEVMALASDRIAAMNQEERTRYDACLKDFLAYERKEHKDTMTSADIAVRWGIPRAHIDTMRSRGEGPAWRKVGGRVVYERKDVEMYERSYGIEPKV